MEININKVIAAFSGALLCLSLSAPMHADDTEIFFGQNNDSFDNNPNILFILDNSGSMTNLDDGTTTRMDRMKVAMNTLLDQSSSYNVGFMSFQGRDWGGAIRYPIGYLESNSEALCNGVCPDERVVSRPDGGKNDATQNDTTQAVDLNAAVLRMANINTDTSTSSDIVGTQITRQYVAAADVSEYIYDGTTRINGYNKLYSTWFYSGLDELNEAYYAYRFDNIVVPANASITSAKITFRHTSTDAQTGNVAAYINAEATPTPTPYPDGINGELSLEERRDPARRTNALVAWDTVPPDNSTTDTSNDPLTGPYIDTPDISELLNELVSLPGWDRGNSMSFMINPFDFYTPSAADLRRLYGSSATDDKAPVLTFTYTTVDNQDSTTTSFNAATHVDEITSQESEEVSRNRNNVTTELFYAGTTNHPRELGLRFANISIPPNAVIKTAYLTLRTADTNASTDAPEEWKAVAGSGNELVVSEDNSPSGSNGATPDNATITPAETPTFSINVHAELDESPSGYSQQLLRDRTYTASFVNWPDIMTSDNTDVVSPDLSGLIEQVTDLADWTTGDTLSLRLSIPEDQINIPDNIIRVQTPKSGTRPSLQITWEGEDTSVTQAEDTQTTAIRFSQVHIPPGADIKSARIVFHSAEANDEPTILDITGEKASASEVFRGTANNLDSRVRTTAQETWPVEPWATIGNPYSTPDITRIIQEITDQNDWCGGNDMTLFLSGEGVRNAISADANPIKAPTLEINYAPDSVPSGAFCSNSSVVVSLLDSADDAVQNMNNDQVVINGMSLDTDDNGNGSGQAQMIGLRFRGVNLPKDAKIVSASLQLTSNTDITTATDINISVEQTDNATGFTSSNDNIGNRNWSSPVSWSSTPPVGANEGTFSDELKDSISSIVSRSGWERGNSMAFRLTPSTSSNLRSFSSYDASEAQSARLLIYFESERENPGTRFKDNLKAQVNELVAQGATPIVSSMYEAAQYFRGGTVDYGLRRGKRGAHDRFHRVSHPFSYSGGVVSRSSLCTDANLDSSSCIFETILANSSTPTFISPMESQCQANHIVLLSDGKATSNTAADKIRALSGISCDGSGREAEECGLELAKWLYDNDHSPALPGEQNVTTHTIAFNLNVGDRGFLEDLAIAGGGGSYTADSSESLLTAFKTIFINVSKTDTSFVAPSATLSQANRMKNREDIYYATFKPDSTARWNGNLKKYKLLASEGDIAVIVDKNNQPAIDESNGQFKPGARSYWSSNVDGGSVLLGGAAERLKGNGYDHTYRNVYTYTGSNANLNDPSNELFPDNNALLPEWFALPPNLDDPNGTYYKELVNWTHGQDIQDIDGDQNTSEPRGQMGDPMHSQPVLIDYANGTGTKSMVFVSTNEGFMHAIETETGDEKFAFIPKELLKNQHKFLANEPTRRRPYGLDGGMNFWIDDTNNNGIVDPGESAFLYIAMRRGGSQYYALDVSDLDNPKFMWSIEGRKNTLDADPATADGDYVELADTWSLPVKSQIRDGSTVKDVLIFGGGYDPNQDPLEDAIVDGTTPPVNQTRAIDGIGRAVFIVDAITGEQLWRTSRLDPQFNEMNYSIPSDVRVIDIDFDGLADQLYVGDMGGQIWRIDINNDALQTDTLSNRISGGVIAQLAGNDAEDARRFYYAPDVSIVAIDGVQQLAISIGSGWRAHPLDTVVEDRFYSLRLPYVYGRPIDSFGQTVYPVITHTSTGLIDVTTEENATLDADSNGWFIELGGAGEKVLSPSVTADHKILFTSYLPEADATSCSAAEGSGAIHAISVFNGSAVLDLNESGDDDLSIDDRSRILKHAGIPPATSLLFPEVGEATVVVGTESLEEFSLEELRRRTFWQELVEDDS